MILQIRRLVASHEIKDFYCCDLRCCLQRLNSECVSNNQFIISIARSILRLFLEDLFVPRVRIRQALSKRWRYCRRGPQPFFPPFLFFCSLFLLFSIRFVSNGGEELSSVVTVYLRTELVSAYLSAYRKSPSKLATDEHKAGLCTYSRFAIRNSRSVVIRWKFVIRQCGFFIVRNLYLYHYLFVMIRVLWFRRKIAPLTNQCE